MGNRRPFRPRILVGNIYFAPSSFGGATVIAENMARQLQQKHGWDVIVVTAIDDPALPPYAIRRYVSDGLDVIGVKVPDQHPSSTASWDNEAFNHVFGKILDVTQPDIAHIHCIQNMGGTCLAELKDRRIPFAVTVHDCWWLCERQFMIDHTGHYCNQQKINLEVCRYCVADINMTRRRISVLKRELDKADLLLFPSRFHLDLHVANGFDPALCFLNKNGVNPPRDDYRKAPNDNPATKVRFGFIGGPGPIKGASLIQKAFQTLGRTDYELRIVDAAQNAGATWRKDPVWEMPGKITFVSAYTRETIDDFFSTIDVLLFPSQWKESFGLTVREALVRGIWVITTDAGGAAEDCVDGQNATILPFPSDYKILARAINSLFERDLSGLEPASHVSLVEHQAVELDRYLRSLTSIVPIHGNSSQDLEHLVPGVARPA
jgi:glycosyltransferase involved in cell wall biosynthesis